MHHTRTALACVAVAVGVAACSTPAKAPPPTVDFGPNGGTSVGMPGMSGMPGMASKPASGPAAPTPGAPAPPVAGTAVNITNFAFTPATLTVMVGDTVTWTNHDEEPHTVVANDGSFHSPGLDNNATYSFTFTNPGTFDYTCGIHPFMHGTVVVNR
jgi:amicyanin